MAQVSPPTPTPHAQPIDPSDAPSLTRFLSGIATAFSDTSLSRAFISEIDGSPSTFTVPRILQHISPGITTAAHSGAALIEAGNFSALAVWEPPSFHGVPFSETFHNAGPIREEWRGKIHALKETWIGMEEKQDGKWDFKPFYHLGFLVRNPEVETVKGAISAVVRPWLERAEREGVPVWLEATYPRAVAVYEYFGFRVVEVVRIGVGVRNAEGWPEEGGEGVSGWAMIYDRHLR